MKKEFSQEEMEQVLKNDAVIPASVDEKIKETYARLGLTAAAPEEHNKGSASQKTRPVRMKKKRYGSPSQRLPLWLQGLESPRSR